MENETVIPYDLVATKMNHWYVALKNDWLKIAEDMKEQVKLEIQVMEENQDALIYYSLLEFRHKLMLDYLCPDSARNMEIDEDYQEIKRKTKGGKNLNGMLEYYYHFFSGMYHFRQKEILHAIHYYKNAEAQLESFDCEEVEKAEFYFKLSETYYYLKQTYLSMYYANRAYHIYLDYPTYGQRRVQCQFMIACNWLDKFQPEKALHHNNQALTNAKELKVDHLIGSSHVNIGLCYNQLEELNKAENHITKAVELYKNDQPSYLPKALFNLSYIKARLGKRAEAEDLYFECKAKAEELGDREYLTKLNLIYGLYISFDVDLLRETFNSLNKIGMYADMEEYGVVVAEFLQEKDMLRDSLEFYRKVVEAKRQIQKQI
ncbi:Rap family tetratricopeptide repeat protein [Bacillus changyiensis]|uniref:Rap family tetratricopeptide repeat protein n=1 Tax=Bacillus changyiensis TaxID=3004103 RepID=UPI0022DEC8D2|nr:Rap family tetratricopeptide repeat protein [Bacillus changyiensis]MDA1475950.1 tetratricopeptide repeat protein [Bacillus changyiensis]